MDSRKLLAAAAVAGVLSAGLGLVSAASHREVGDWKGAEKCAGIAAKGKNDCASGSHKCAGNAAEDRAAGEWIWLPEGVCGKIAGGEVVKG